MKNRFVQIESRLQTLIEGGVSRLFPTGQRQADLASRLVDAMFHGIKAGPDGEPVAPNLFILLVSSSEAQALQENQALLDGLASILREAGTGAGLHFSVAPVVRVQGSLDVPSGQIRVTAQNSLANLPQTSDLGIGILEESEAIPLNAFLIVDGTQVVPLTQAVINLGRRADNQVVIEDPRVSRVHAQLRVVKGRFVIFDLDSTGGTFVNGEEVHQCALYPGDVISMAGVPLVFGQDPANMSETQDYVP
ncbi:MAG TPA: FhaA domain-containing protein [Anaerolineales bacterium]